MANRSFIYRGHLSLSVEVMKVLTEKETFALRPEGCLEVRLMTDM